MEEFLTMMDTERLADTIQDFGVVGKPSLHSL